jgi:hypothetical protein
MPRSVAAIIWSSETVPWLENYGSVAPRRFRSASIRTPFTAP